MKGGGHEDHHARMVSDLGKRFGASLIATVLALSSAIQDFLGLTLRFRGDRYAVFAFSSFVFFYGGWPFLKGMLGEQKGRAPGMMTLVSVAVTTAYLYSSAVVFGLSGMGFFWELATLIDIMLLGHWIEM